MVPDGCLSHLLVHHHLVLIPVLLPQLPSWQEVGSDILSNFYDTHNKHWQEEDSSSKLLTSVASVLGSLGYDRATFYLTLAPYWNTLIITLNVFCLSMILTSIVMSYNIVLSLRMKDKFCPVSWILQHILVEIVLLALLVVLLMNLGNTARMQLEDKM